MGQSESTVYMLLCSPYSWSVLLSLLMFWHPPAQTARDRLFILSRKQDFRLPPRQQERPHVQKFIQSFLFQFLFIPTFKGACQFLRLLRILQGRLFGSQLSLLLAWDSAFSGLPSHPSSFQSPKSCCSCCLFVPPLPPTLWIYALRKKNAFTVLLVGFQEGAKLDACI